MDKALRDNGLANRKAVLGEDYVNKSMAAADAFNGPFQEILNEYCWGMIWSDERLPRKPLPVALPMRQNAVHLRGDRPAVKNRRHSRSLACAPFGFGVILDGALASGRPL